ncbi:MAG: peroxiredoxin [Candidatus Entotheonellia bacterium]
MLQIGWPAPAFKGQVAMTDGAIKEIALADYRGQWVVLCFYPLDFTFVCPTELRGFNHCYKEFIDLKAEVIGISVDSVYTHLAWIAHGLGGLQFPLLSDLTKQISRDYGVLLEDSGVALRATVLIDPEGIVRSFTVNDLAVGRGVDETLRLLRAFQTGELTPCNWEPGQATLGR